jgi:hypothetical protein
MVPFGRTHDLWQRCASTHGFRGHPVKFSCGFEIGFSNVGRLIVAECLRCGATFTELDGAVEIEE